MSCALLNFFPHIPFSCSFSFNFFLSSASLLLSIRDLIRENQKALITISTRASLKRHHTYNLILGLDTGVGTIDWTLERIGTEAEKLGVDRELAQLRHQLTQVERWKARKAEIERELNRVWVVGGAELDSPSYLREGQEEREGNDRKEDGDEEEGNEGKGKGKDKDGLKQREEDEGKEVERERQEGRSATG